MRHGRLTLRVVVFVFRLCDRIARSICMRSCEDWGWLLFFGHEMSVGDVGDDFLRF